MERRKRSSSRERMLFLSSINLDPNDLTAWRIKWTNLQHGGKGCLLTFEQYVLLAKDVGITSPNQIGRSRGQFQMGRIGDSGIYELGNCRFITQEQNQSEKKLNGGFDRMVQNMTCNIRSAKKFRLFSPDGETFEGIDLKTFCIQNGLNRGNMSSVCRGERVHHKGWRGIYVQ